MNDYTIYCTEEQTKKALELGAPIEQTPMLDILRNEIGERCFLSGTSLYWFPTTEQMIGWLEEQEEICDIHAHKIITSWSFIISQNIDYILAQKEYPTRQEATLAAIDNALDYLISKKGE